VFFIALRFSIGPAKTKEIETLEAYQKIDREYLEIR
jgi:hypothetical protein